ncbi:MAG: LamG-like jellyroll fold domain-containing protein, partial [Candidatus Latescibacter sp.]|nr:LamG-like jellyroll fold domain-containing protein [Candidatus Latescibacter sp.]
MKQGSLLQRIVLLSALMAPGTLLSGTVLHFSSAFAYDAKNPGLIFYLSGDKGFTADYAAGGDPEPNFLRDVKIIPNGAKGPGFQCENTQLMSYWAPGNIYAERGTLAFFWRSRDPVGKVQFPIFRVGYADHSSWDMVWLRIDYNGNGFDAFVTDANLGRARVSYAMPSFPKPDQWVHLALAWDETQGIRFYVNGALAAKKDTTAVFYTGLDQFGPHSRIISPYQVQSEYNFKRGGDIDEILIYDRMLSLENISGLSKGEIPADIPSLVRDLNNPTWRNEWWLRYGWNRPGDVPPALFERTVSVRKVEIHDVYDLKRWWWKGTDGIRETTWPGVYNRSRIIGRNDYFQLPDWDCYSTSGKSVTFFMSDEPWNHLEISGAAFGAMSLLSFDKEKQANTETVLFSRPKNQEKTFHRLVQPVTGQKIRFDNIEQETPIGELSACYVSGGKEPQGIYRLSYTVTGKAEPDNGNLESLVRFINGRYMADERSIMVALPGGAPRTPKKTAPAANMLPLVHILIPCEFRGGIVQKDYTRFSYTWENMNAGLDGIAIDIPPLSVKPTHGEYFPMNIQVKDPIWPYRNLFDFTFSVKPGEAKTLWMDTRDRILPNGKSLYLTIAGAGADFGPASLEGAQIRLVFKPRKDAAPEHEMDRFTQVRDNYAHLVEEYPNSRRLNLFTRFETDAADLLRVNPDHYPGLNYWYDNNKEQAHPPFVQPAAPLGVPLWAFRQVEDLRYLKRFVNWWIDNRQIENGELGGGLSDDGDLTNWWPGAALMGCTPEKIKDSVLREMDAFYNNGMFTNGLSTIQTDELHTYEEGIEVLPQVMLLDYANPKVVERIMETSKALERITGINQAGHRHIRSSYFSGTKIAEEGVWEWIKPYSHLVLHPALALVEFNGNPRAKKLLLELADGILAHRKKDAQGNFTIDTTINFRTDEGIPAGLGALTHLFYAAWRWTGDGKYLQPLLDAGPGVLGSIDGNALDTMGKRDTWGRQIAASVTPQSGSDHYRHIAWQVTGNKQNLENYYADQIEAAALREYINTEGSLWTDRVTVANSELQRSRLGGVAIVRLAIYPGHAVSWKFKAPATDESMAILIPNATPTGMKIIAYNLDSIPVQAVMTAWDIEPGSWEITQGIDTNNDDNPEFDPATRIVDLERTGSLDITFAPRAATVITLQLKSKGTPYWERPDIGIGKDDVTVQGNTVKVRVHSLGAADAPATTAVIRDRSGKVIASAPVPALKAPVDLLPKTAEVAFKIPTGIDLDGGEVYLDPDRKIKEITVCNN